MSIITMVDLGTTPPWAECQNGDTADGRTVHEVFATDGAAVTAKVMELSTGWSDRGFFEFDELPGWGFAAGLFFVSAHYRSDTYPTEGYHWVPSVTWNDPAYGGDDAFVFGAYRRYATDCCVYCGMKLDVAGGCPMCGAS